MSFTIGENYLLKAIEAYPFNLEAVSENLGYALSYDEENDAAWTLRGKVMMHYLKDTLGAEESFLEALSLNAIIANRATGDFSKDPKKTVDKLIIYALERIVNI